HRQISAAGAVNYENHKPDVFGYFDVRAGELQRAIVGENVDCVLGKAERVAGSRQQAEGDAFDRFFGRIVDGRDVDGHAVRSGRNRDGQIGPRAQHIIVSSRRVPGEGKGNGQRIVGRAFAAHDETAA